MNSRERVLGAFNRTGIRPDPVKHEGTPEINQNDYGSFWAEEYGAIIACCGR